MVFVIWLLSLFTKVHPSSMYITSFNCWIIVHWVDIPTIFCLFIHQLMVICFSTLGLLWIMLLWALMCKFCVSHMFSILSFLFWSNSRHTGSNMGLLSTVFAMFPPTVTPTSLLIIKIELVWCTCIYSCSPSFTWNWSSDTYPPPHPTPTKKRPVFQAILF